MLLLLWPGKNQSVTMPKIIKTNVACKRCTKSHIKCNDYLPCNNCLLRGIGETCVRKPPIIKLRISKKSGMEKLLRPVSLDTPRMDPQSNLTLTLDKDTKYTPFLHFEPGHTPEILALIPVESELIKPSWEFVEQTPKIDTDDTRFITRGEKPSDTGPTVKKNLGGRPRLSPRLTLDDKLRIIEYQKQYGSRWKFIAQFFPGIPYYTICSYWRTYKMSLDGTTEKIISDDINGITTDLGNQKFGIALQTTQSLTVDTRFIASGDKPILGTHSVPSKSEDSTTAIMAIPVIPDSPNPLIIKIKSNVIRDSVLQSPGVANKQRLNALIFTAQVALQQVQDAMELASF